MTQPFSLGCFGLNPPPPLLRIPEAVGMSASTPKDNGLVPTHIRYRTS